MLDGIAYMILNRHEPGGSWRWVILSLKILIYGVNLAFFLALAFAMLGMNILGERNLAFAKLLFGPAHFWLLPQLVLVPLCIITFRLKLVITHGVVAVLFVMVYMDYQIQLLPRHMPDDALVILSNNRGQNMGTSLRPYIHKIDPDLICLQESGRAHRYARAEGYEPYHDNAVNQSEFDLLSKYTVTGSGVLNYTTTRGRQARAGAWFTIDYHGTEVVIYQTHPASPRDSLYISPGVFFYGLTDLSPINPWQEQVDERMGYWYTRREHFEHLTRILKQETRPFLVAGDFNMVDRGFFYSMFADFLQDTHEAAGAGYGYTFPGTGGGFYTFGQPFLRIDYIFASHHWHVLHAEVEPGRGSQHRALAAAMRLRG
jgi:endonuclease/exonuclease/phosphatase family metal-dependent hydrolase